MLAVLAHPEDTAGAHGILVRGIRGVDPARKAVRGHRRSAARHVDELRGLRRDAARAELSSSMRELSRQTGRRRTAVRALHELRGPRHGPLRRTRRRHAHRARAFPQRALRGHVLHLRDRSSRSAARRCTSTPVWSPCSALRAERPMARTPGPGARPFAPAFAARRKLGGAGRRPRRSSSCWSSR